MGILQGFLSFSFGVAFLIFVLFVAWYIALPLIFLFIIIGVIGYIRNRFLLSDLQKKMSQRFKRTYQYSKNEQIIDVDYTEIK